MPCFRGGLGRGGKLYMSAMTIFFHWERLFFIPGPSFFKASFFYELVTGTSKLCTDADICSLCLYGILPQ